MGFLKRMMSSGATPTAYAWILPPLRTLRVVKRVRGREDGNVADMVGCSSDEVATVDSAGDVIRAIRGIAPTGKKLFVT
jgi:hypothetical protein